MRNKFKHLLIIFLVMTIGFIIVTCDNNNGPGNNTSSNDPETVTYTSYDINGNSYALTITENQSRAVYITQIGDGYILIIKAPNGTEIGKSTGTVSDVDGLTLELKKGNDTFSVTVIENNISSIVNSIPLDGGGTSTPPTAFLFQNPYTANGGKFTLTGIPSQYNGQWASIPVINFNVGEDISAWYMIHGVNEIISNGSVSIPLITSGNNLHLALYSGNDTTDVKISISNFISETVSINFESITFSNGSISKSWNEGTVSTGIDIEGEEAPLKTTYTGVVNSRDGTPHTGTVYFTVAHQVQKYPSDVLNMEISNTLISEFAPGSEIKVENGTLTITLGDVTNENFLQDVSMFSDTPGLKICRIGTTFYSDNNDDNNTVDLFWINRNLSRSAGLVYANKDGIYSFSFSGMHTHMVLKQGWNTVVTDVNTEGSYMTITVTGEPDSNYKWEVQYHND